MCVCLLSASLYVFFMCLMFLHVYVYVYVHVFSCVRIFFFFLNCAPALYAFLCVRGCVVLVRCCAKFEKRCTKKIKEKIIFEVIRDVEKKRENKRKANDSLAGRLSLFLFFHISHVTRRLVEGGR